MKIPETITAASILSAIKYIDENGVPKNRKSTKYCVVYQNKMYPPKYVISLAYKELVGEELDSDLFSGGIQTNSFLENLGFQTLSLDKANNLNYIPYSVNDL